MKTLSTTLGVARSNVIERRDGNRSRRGPQERPGDVELAGAIRTLVDVRPTYGYRRIAALIAIRAPHPVQWLSDNGSIFAAHKTIEIALALNLAPCFTPVESPESNGMAEAFVKTFKRDYVRVSPIPDALAALALVDRWMEDYNTVHPHSRRGYRSPREYILSQPVPCPV